MSTATFQSYSQQIATASQGSLTNINNMAMQEWLRGSISDAELKRLQDETRARLAVVMPNYVPDVAQPTPGVNNWMSPPPSSPLAQANTALAATIPTPAPRPTPTKGGDVLMTNPQTGQQVWIPPANVAAYQAGGWTEGQVAPPTGVFEPVEMVNPQTGEKVWARTAGDVAAWERAGWTRKTPTTGEGNDPSTWTSVYGINKGEPGWEQAVAIARKQLNGQPLTAQETAQAQAWLSKTAPQLPGEPSPTGAELPTEYEIAPGKIIKSVGGYDFLIETDPIDTKAPPKVTNLGATAKPAAKPEGLWATYAEALTAAGTSGYVPEQLSSGYWGLAAPQKATPTYPAPEEAPTDGQGRTATWDTDNGMWRYPPDWGQPKLTKEGFTPAEQFTKEQALWQRTQAAEAAKVTQRNYLAQLAANPRSWLEYAAASEQAPAVQTWMLPLMPQEYAGTVAGAPIPGWGNPPTMAQLPALTTPGRQYQARMGPTAMEQWQGYEQARTGARPEESAWRLWSQAPPSGKAPTLSYLR